MLLGGRGGGGGGQLSTREIVQYNHNVMLVSEKSVLGSLISHSKHCGWQSNFVKPKVMHSVSSAVSSNYLLSYQIGLLDNSVIT